MSESRQDTGAFTWVVVAIFAALFVIVALLIVLLVRIIEPGPPENVIPTPEPAVEVSIQDLRFVAELATVRSSTVAEVQNERIPDDFRRALGVKEQLLLLVYADVKAGFDLNELSEDDLLIDGTRVVLALPPPKILSVTIDQQRTHVAYYQKSWLIQNDIDLVQDAYQVADQAVRAEAVQQGILDQAAAYGRIYYENQLRQLGFTDVQVVVR